MSTARPGGEPSTFDNIDPDAIDLWNARLEDLAAEHETVHVSSDWADVVTRASAAELLEDGLHPNVAGQRRLARAKDPRQAPCAGMCGLMRGREHSSPARRPRLRCFATTAMARRCLAACAAGQTTTATRARR